LSDVSNDAKFRIFDPCENYGRVVRDLYTIVEAALPATEPPKYILMAIHCEAAEHGGVAPNSLLCADGAVKNLLTH